MGGGISAPFVCIISSTLDSQDHAEEDKEDQEREYFFEGQRIDGGGGTAGRTALDFREKMKNKRLRTESICIAPRRSSLAGHYFVLASVYNESRIIFLFPLHTRPYVAPLLYTYFHCGAITYVYSIVRPANCIFPPRVNAGWFAPHRYYISVMQFHTPHITS